MPEKWCWEEEVAEVVSETGMRVLVFDAFACVSACPVPRGDAMRCESTSHQVR